MNKTNITKDTANKKMVVTRTFSAPVGQVWRAWTERDMLDQWWAPKPWRANTKSMDFREGGSWLYCMEGPDGTKQWACFNYGKIETEKSFENEDLFCDENGEPNNTFPTAHWHNTFTETGDGTEVKVDMQFASVEDMEKIIETGFEEGFTAAHDNLEELLSEK